MMHGQTNIKSLFAIIQLPNIAVSIQTYEEHR
jgi:hypothetical protein